MSCSRSNHCRCANNERTTAGGCPAHRQNLHGTIAVNTDKISPQPQPDSSASFLWSVTVGKCTHTHAHTHLCYSRGAEEQLGDVSAVGLYFMFQQLVLAFSFLSSLHIYSPCKELIEPHPCEVAPQWGVGGRLRLAVAT